MGKEYVAKVFKSGNSLALRLPKALGLVEGVEMRVREEGGRYSFEPASPTQDTIDLTGLYGSVPGLAIPTDESRVMEPRELDWHGLAKRG